MKCAHCGGEESPGLPLVQYGGKRSGPMVLHRACWEAKAVEIAEAARVALRNGRETNSGANFTGKGR